MSQSSLHRRVKRTNHKQNNRRVKRTNRKVKRTNRKVKRKIQHRTNRKQDNRRVKRTNRKQNNRKQNRTNRKLNQRVNRRIKKKSYKKISGGNKWLPWKKGNRVSPEDQHLDDGGRKNTPYTTENEYQEKIKKAMKLLKFGAISKILSKKAEFLDYYVKKKLRDYPRDVDHLQPFDVRQAANFLSKVSEFQGMRGTNERSE